MFAYRYHLWVIFASVIAIQFILLPIFRPSVVITDQAPGFIKPESGLKGHDSKLPRSAPLLSPLLTEVLEETYLTLWLQQVHQWFKTDRVRLRRFLSQAKEAGFGSIMTDVPWSWTERAKKGVFDFNSHGKDWLGEVCDQGLKLHIVLRANELPPWVSLDELVEIGERSDSHPLCNETFASPSLGSNAIPYVEEFM